MTELGWSINFVIPEYKSDSLNSIERPDSPNIALLSHITLLHLINFSKVSGKGSEFFEKYKMLKNP